MYNLSIGNCLFIIALLQNIYVKVSLSIAYYFFPVYYLLRTKFLYARVDLFKFICTTTVQVEYKL